MSYGAAPFASAPYGALGVATKGGSVILGSTFGITAGASSAFLSTFIPDGEIPIYERFACTAGGLAAFSTGKIKYSQFGISAGAVLAIQSSLIDESTEVVAPTAVNVGAGATSNFKGGNWQARLFAVAAGGSTHFVSFADGSRIFSIVAGAAASLQSASRRGRAMTETGGGVFAPSAAALKCTTFVAAGRTSMAFSCRDDNAVLADAPEVLFATVKMSQAYRRMATEEIYVHA